MKRSVVLACLVSLYLLHFDFWFWHRFDLRLGMPVGLLYHFGYCLVVSVVLAWLLGVFRRRSSPIDSAGED